MRTFLAVVLIGLAGPALADNFHFVCQNPGQSYEVEHRGAAREVTVDPDSRAVHQAILAATGDFYVLDLGKPGMVSVLYLKAPRQNLIFSDGSLVQTDSCK